MTGDLNAVAVAVPVAVAVAGMGWVEVVESGLGTQKEQKEHKRWE
jgi:hypothetical protein